MLNIMDGNIRCKCGATHDGRLNIQKDLPLIDVLKGLLEHGRVLIIASKEVDKGYLDTMSCLEMAEEKGLKKGMAQGVINVARSMKIGGVDYAIISKHTNLTISDIEKL